MAEISKMAESVIEDLLEAEEHQLYEQLGLRIKGIEEDLTKCSSFEPNVVYDEAHMGLKKDLRELGRRLFRRWNIEAYKFICGSDPNDKEDREELAKAFKVKDPYTTVAAVLSALLVTKFGLAPAISVVIAALAIKRFFRPAYEEFCKYWREKIDTGD